MELEVEGEALQPLRVIHHDFPKAPTGTEVPLPTHHVIDTPFVQDPRIITMAPIPLERQVR